MTQVASQSTHQCSSRHAETRHMTQVASQSTHQCSSRHAETRHMTQVASQSTHQCSSYRAQTRHMTQVASQSTHQCSSYRAQTRHMTQVASQSTHHATTLLNDQCTEYHFISILQKPNAAHIPHGCPPSTCELQKVLDLGQVTEHGNVTQAYHVPQQSVASHSWDPTQRHTSCYRSPTQSPLI